MPNLSEFPEGLQFACDLLQCLVVSKCKDLKGLPECLQDCNELLELVINTCPNIISLPRGIHTVKTLRVLRIFGCPELVAKCESKKGEYRHLISNIPKVHLRPPSSKGHGPEHHPNQALGEPESSSSQYCVNMDEQV